MSRTKPNLVLAALLAIVVLTLTAVGALEDVWTWVRVTTQGLGTLAGVYLGAKITNDDDRRSVEASARTALANLYSLAASIQHMLQGLETARRRSTDNPPASIVAAVTQAEIMLDGMQTQVLVLLSQAEAAAQAWVPYVSADWLAEQKQAKEPQS